jgi:hypothetical protein
MTFRVELNLNPSSNEENFKEKKRRELTRKKILLLLNEKKMKKIKQDLTPIDELGCAFATRSLAKYSHTQILS